MTVSERMSNAGLVPVVVLENAADAVPTARALLAGGVDVMEITFRTAAAEDSIPRRPSAQWRRNAARWSLAPVRW